MDRILYFPIILICTALALWLAWHLMYRSSQRLPKSWEKNMFPPEPEPCDASAEQDLGSQLAGYFGTHREEPLPEGEETARGEKILGIIKGCTSPEMWLLLALAREAIEYKKYPEELQPGSTPYRQVAFAISRVCTERCTTPEYAR